MALVTQTLDDFKSVTPHVPKKVKEYREKAKKDMLKKQYRKAYKYLHKAKKYKYRSDIIVDEFWMLYS